MGPNPNGPGSVSCDSSLLDTQAFSGSVKRGFCRFDFLDSLEIYWVDSDSPDSDFHLMSPLAAKSVNSGNLGIT